MDVSPFFRTPFTDLTGCLISHQWYGRCADLELKTVECLEAYGMERGLRKCSDLMQDFRECGFRTKQISRNVAMRDERERQYKAGERSAANLYAEPPKLDSF
ncbi:PREDICTED: NADH dehydrogenase [ubiquinone] iron-sulfur protein 5 [Nicrophorus vespilloides]|uniref:NADH dehydrogenase [ubiquinone] iron-sulfur protein 5 n=1 Tax=Nicrophorus vespilloides TaxID=110193 RepID=A0ABM1M0S7_NICVS|nr:PREDICTED: NADH dehydrogenase [ubiquinone] iron-sulfur protein 5 [Nicrophorus vespilloides]XP_017768178.1 PREDICTED: NADH dehydrogenase [ubiquinone] iron-sulfur protein 5 [Nicrophorus vespilloides]